MAALSDYLESALLNHIFKSTLFPAPTNISIALTGDVPRDNDDGSTIPEIPLSVSQGGVSVDTGYARISTSSATWSETGVDNLTAFSVYSNDEDHSGYFYPLYLSQEKAIQVDDANNGNAPSQAVTYEFSEFPGDKFYSPLTLTQSGVPEDPGYEQYTGNGFIKNKLQLVFPSAMTDWGMVSGVAILDSSDHQDGNLLMYAELNNPRYVYAGDTIKFDGNALEINLN